MILIVAKGAKASQSPEPTQYRLIVEVTWGEGCLHDTGIRYNDFIPVPSCRSLFVSMMPVPNLMLV